MFRSATSLLADTKDIFAYGESGDLIAQAQLTWAELDNIVHSKGDYDYDRLCALIPQLKDLYQKVVIERNHRQGREIEVSILLASPAMQDFSEWLDSLTGRLPESQLDQLFLMGIEYALGDNGNGN